MYGHLFNKIGGVAAIASETEETWVSLSLSGQYKQQYSKTLFSELNETVDELGKSGCITYRLGNSIVTIEELQESLVTDAQWNISINKQSFMGDEDEICTFFFFPKSFRQWAGNADPFSAKYPFNNHRCKIEVNGLLSSFGGPNFLVSGNINELHEDGLLTYEPDRLMSVLRQFTSAKREIHPERHYVAFGNVDEYSSPFYKNSLKCLTISLCDELYESKVVLRGIRRLEFNLQDTQYDGVQMGQAQESLREAFRWVFCGDSRYELRHKLLMDRLTLDLPQNQSFYDGVIPLISHALRQAAERFSYAFFERANEYQKELQQFLKELHGLCDSYSNKVRSLLGNFLRDALAGLLTVAITVFARIRELEKLDSGDVLYYIFYAFAGYLLISCLVQSIVDWKDLRQSEKEIDYWKSVSREYMSDEDFENHKKKTVGERKKLAVKQYVSLAFLYIGLAVFSFNVPKMWNKLSHRGNDTEVQQECCSVLKEINNLTIDSSHNEADTVSGNKDTTVCHTPGGKQK